MNKLLFSLCILCGTYASAALTGECGSRSSLTDNITSQIPEIDVSSTHGFMKVPNVAQYKMADWSQAIGIAKGISMTEAYQIAENNPEITFFFYTKGGQMVLEKEDSSYRVFQHGDTVFFSGEPWWGSAPGLADGYIKTR
jgi:hypothetical protein